MYFLHEFLPTSGVRKQRALEPGWQGFDLRCHYAGVCPCRSPFRLRTPGGPFAARGGTDRARPFGPSARDGYPGKRSKIGSLLAGLTAFVDPDPAPGNHFGAAVVALSTGNVVITSPFDNAGGTGAGAVYLFNGTTGALISTLIGSHAGDNIGSGGVTALADGNFVVDSPDWTNGAAADLGAVTWGSGTTGVSGAVSATNSLVGSTANDSVGSGGVTALSNGNYVVSSPNWTNGAAARAGAVTWGSGTAGVSGAVSATNSLVGSTANDQVGGGTDGGVTALSNGNYVVEQPQLDQRRGRLCGRGHVGQRHGRRQRCRQCHEQPGRQYGE